MREMFTNHSARKTTVSKLKKANIVRSDIAKVTGYRSIDFLHDYDEAHESNDNSLLQCPNEKMTKSKYWQFPTSQQLWLHSPIDDSVEREQIASFIFGF